MLKWGTKRDDVMPINPTVILSTSSVYVLSQQMPLFYMKTDFVNTLIIFNYAR